MKFTCGKPLGSLIGLRERCRRLQEENKRVKKHALHLFLENLMLSDNDDTDAAGELADYLGGNLDTICFTMLLIYPNDEWNVPDKIVRIFEAIEYQFNIHLGQYSSLVFFNSNVPQGIACLAIQDNLTPEDVALLDVLLGAEIAELCMQAAAALQAEHGISVRVAVSPLQFGAENIRRLYRETLIIHDHCYDSTKTVTTSYDLYAATSNFQDIDPAVLERQFLNFVMSKQFFQAVSVLDSIIDYTITTSRPTLEHMASSVFSRLETVLALSGVEILPPPKGDAAISNVLERLMKANDFGEIRDYVHDFFALLDDAFSDLNAQSKIAKVKDYILENYNLTSMGAALVCREFKFSASYLSRLFKSELGISIVDYIHSIRIEKAKLLLAQTDDTIDNIAIQVGFTNRWALIRIFKEHEGVTPGVYRQAVGTGG